VWTATGLENRGDRKVGGSTPQLSAILRMVAREVRHCVASAAIPKGYGGLNPSPSAMDGWQSGNAARWRRAKPARVRTFDPCTVRQSSRIAQSAERRALNSEVPRASRGAAATAPSSNGRTPSFGLGDAGSIPAGAAIHARSPIQPRVPVPRLPNWQRPLGQNEVCPGSNPGRGTKGSYLPRRL
jgi:hypothetical protein